VPRVRPEPACIGILSEGRKLGLNGHDEESTLSIGQTPVSCSLSGHTGPHGSSSNGSGGMHRRILKVSPETDRHCDKWLAPATRPRVGTSSGLLLEFRARVSKPWENLLVRLTDRNKCTPSGCDLAGISPWFPRLDVGRLLGNMHRLRRRMYFRVSHPRGIDDAASRQDDSLSARREPASGR